MNAITIFFTKCWQDYHRVKKVCNNFFYIESSNVFTFITLAKLYLDGYDITHFNYLSNDNSNFNYVKGKQRFDAWKVRDPQCDIATFITLIVFSRAYRCWEYHSWMLSEC